MTNNIEKLEQLNKQLDTVSHMSKCIDGTSVIIDKNATILFCSPCIKDLLGYEVSELVGKPLTILIHPINKMQHDILEQLTKHSSNMLNEKSSLMYTGREVYAKHKDGRPIYIHVYANEIKNNDSVLFLGTMRLVNEKQYGEN